MEIIVTGGAGYIGSHVVNSLIEEGASVMCIDNLSTGNLSFVHPEAAFKCGDVQDFEFIKKCMQGIREPENAGVIHLAGLKYASESVQKPIDFYAVNIGGTLNLLKNMDQHGIRNIVFSSSCSIYGGIESGEKVTEKAKFNPLSPYAKSKLYAENIIEDVGQAYGMNSVSLRYFNVAGNGNIQGLDRSPYNIFPNLYRSFSQGTKFTIFGNDFETSDGTCIRDYLDVDTLSRFHTSMIRKMIAGEKLASAYNLGSETGHSVLEIVNMAKMVIGKDLEVEIAPRRVGDPAQILADCSFAKSQLGWQHNVSLSKMTADGWQAWERFYSN